MLKMTIEFGRLKAGVNLKVVFMPIKIGFMEISRSRFKQSKISLLKTETNVIGCFVNFGYIWEEIVFLEGLVKSREIRNIEDLVRF